ncbi:MAG: helix-turn-helix domain-containing protein [Granulosicoccus sp.]
MQRARTPKQIGSILYRQRDLAELSQHELGNKAGLRQATVSKIESGSPTTRIQTICALLAALDLELQIVPRRKGSADNIEDIF